uniref:ATP-dependent DNA helicase n=1 Tax=Heterorhabditis bacteriophora TaxID=37862 RepID=A0A1I7WKI1_HETBA
MAYEQRHRSADREMAYEQRRRSADREMAYEQRHRSADREMAYEQRRRSADREMDYEQRHRSADREMAYEQRHRSADRARVINQLPVSPATRDVEGVYLLRACWRVPQTWVIKPLLTTNKKCTTERLTYYKLRQLCILLNCNREKPRTGSGNPLQRVPIRLRSLITIVQTRTHSVCHLGVACASHCNTPSLIPSYYQPICSILRINTGSAI